MELIDKRGKINKASFKQFIKYAEDDEILIDCKDQHVKTSATDLLIDLFSMNVDDKKDVDVTMTCKDKQVVFTGKDFNWFLKADRLADLCIYVYDRDILNLQDGTNEEKKDIVKTKTVTKIKLPDMTQCHVAVASIEEEPVIEEKVGLKQECIVWLNQQIVKHANIENEVSMLICLDFDSANPDWKRLDELFNEGKIDIC